MLSRFSRFIARRLFGPSLDAAPPSTLRTVGIFVDAENVLNFLKDGGASELIKIAIEEGQPIVRKAFGDWSNGGVGAHQGGLAANGFQLVQVPSRKGKNGADIAMVVEVMKTRVEMPDMQIFVLATGDSDFSHVVAYLREEGKTVVGVGPRSWLSEVVKNSCNRFVYTNENEGEGGVIDIDAAHELLRRAARSLGLKRGDTLCPSRINEFMGNEFSGRDDALRLGFNSFTELIAASGSFDVIDCGGGNRMVEFVADDIESIGTRPSKAYAARLLSKPTGQSGEIDIDAAHHLLRRAVHDMRLQPGEKCNPGRVNERMQKINIKFAGADDARRLGCKSFVDFVVKSGLFTSLSSGDLVFTNSTATPRKFAQRASESETLANEIVLQLSDTSGISGFEFYGVKPHLAIAQGHGYPLYTINTDASLEFEDFVARNDQCMLAIAKTTCPTFEESRTLLDCENIVLHSSSARSDGGRALWEAATPALNNRGERLANYPTALRRLSRVRNRYGDGYDRKAFRGYQAIANIKRNDPKIMMLSREELVSAVRDTLEERDAAITTAAGDSESAVELPAQKTCSLPTVEENATIPSGQWTNRLGGKQEGAVSFSFVSHRAATTALEHVPNTGIPALEERDAPTATSPTRTKKPASSKYRGVSWSKQKRAWQVALTTPERKKVYLGTFKDEAEAARAYDDGIREHYPGDAKPRGWREYNLPEHVLDSTSAKVVARYHHLDSKASGFKEWGKVHGKKAAVTISPAGPNWCGAWDSGNDHVAVEPHAAQQHAARHIFAEGPDACQSGNGGEAETAFIDAAFGVFMRTLY